MSMGLQEEVTELRYENKYLQDMLSKSWRPGHKYINWCQDGFQGMNKSHSRVHPVTASILHCVLLILRSEEK